MIISSIVAVGRNNEIGVDDDLPWHLPADLKYFKNTTSGHHVLMGRKSFDSVGRPLPGRTNIIVTQNQAFYHSGVHVVHAISDGIKLARDAGEEELFILGGGTIYEQTQHIWNKLYITEIDIEVPAANAFFPKIDFSKWKLSSEKCFPSDDENHYEYCFKVFTR